MKKTKILSLILALLMVFSMTSSTFATAYDAEQTREQSAKWFYTARFTPELKQFIQDSYKTIAPVIANDLLDLGVFLTEISVGTPVSIDNTDGFFYVPLLHNGAVVYVICVGATGNPNSPYSLAYGKLFADELNMLPGNEIYRVVNFEEDVYAVSQNVRKLLMKGPGVSEGEHTHEDIGITESESLQNESAAKETASLNGVDTDVYEVVSLESITDTIMIPRQSRVLNEKVVSVPYVANGGAYGYCWLSASLSIVNYFRKTSYTAADSFHNQAGHSGHTLYYCPIGYLEDCKTLLSAYSITSSTPINSYMTPSSVMSYLDSNSPILVNHAYYNAKNERSGHAFVLCGYSYDTYDNTRITYVYTDSNSSTKVAVTYYSASGISSLTKYNYNISGNNYVWEWSVNNIKY